MNDLELLKRYLQNEIDSGSHKIFIFDKDYNTIEFKVVNALSEIEFIEEENNKLQSNWNSLFEYAKQQLEKAFDKVEQDTWEEVLDKMNELEGKSND